MQVAVSVIIPVYCGAQWVETCLQSFQRQTLESEKFELVLIFNGPEDGAREIVGRFSERHPDLNMVLLRAETASASLARNVGVEHARGEYITWVDCDDWVSENYLELLSFAAHRRIVPVAQIVDVLPDGTRDESSAINVDILSRAEGLVAAKALRRMMTIVACKLVPRAVAMETPFDCSLRSGEDVAAFARIFAAAGLRFDVTPALAGAKYYRLRREGSVSRQVPNFDFSVAQRLDVIESLNETLKLYPGKLDETIKGLINSQTHFMRRYLELNPSEYQRVADLVTSAYPAYFPWELFNGSADKLVVAYNFAPYADTGAVVAAKRIRNEANVVDVISNRMDGARKKDDDILSLVRPYIRDTVSIDLPVAFGSWSTIGQFVARGMEIILARFDGRPTYRELYSRAMWPASHFLAAIYKIRFPHVRWTAEFSDPLSIDSVGCRRQGLVGIDEISEELLDALPESIRTGLAETRNLFEWAEIVPYLLADELVFTNPNQLEVMSSCLARPEIREVVREKATISPQPTLPECFYRIGNPAILMDAATANIAYFGDFYSTRGLEEVLDALGRLDARARTRVKLYVFTSNVARTKAEFQTRGLADDTVSVNESIPYFDFLAALNRFDCLIVNDARTRDHYSVNPYLPSKWSDYSGSASAKWGIVERGSSLAAVHHLDFKTFLGDVAAAEEVLSELISRKMPGDTYRARKKAAE
ncbi:glycosyltransferase [Lysobacter sp. A378]